jgi:hypothetical protein
MNTKKHSRKTWLLSAVLAAGVSGYIPVIYNSPDNTAYAQSRRDNDTDGDGRQVKYDSLPRNVQRALDRERNDRDVKKIVHVDKENREYWRAIVDGKGGNDIVVVINKDGEVIRRDRVDDVNVIGADRNNDLRRDRASDRDADRGYDGRGTWVKYNQTPRAVQEALDRERGNADIKQIIRVTSGDETYYRATIHDRRGDRMVVVNSRGRLLEEREVGEARLARGRYDTADDERQARVRRDYYNEGERLDFDRLPGEVKTAIGREAGSDRVREVTAYTGRGGGTIYRAEVSNGDTRRIIRVDDQGRVFPEREANTGRGGDRMRFNDLPGEVKTAVGRHSTPDKIESVTRVTRGGRTEYVVVCDDGPTVHTMTFDERGRMVDDEEGRQR